MKLLKGMKKHVFPNMEMCSKYISVKTHIVDKYVKYGHICFFFGNMFIYIYMIIESMYLSN